MSAHRSAQYSLVLRLEIADRPGMFARVAAALGDNDASIGSIDLVDARHPQTILSYGMNGKALPVENGAPLRVRVERQLGYKMPKYIQRIELVDDFSAMGLGRGGYWEDRGYDWFGGI